MPAGGCQLPVSVTRIWHTLRWLRAEQIAAQIRHRTLARWLPPRAPAAAPAFPGLRWQPRGALPPPGAQRNSAAGLERGVFVFLNREETLGFPPERWDAPELPALWRYNLHYWEWLWALPFDAAVAAAEDWIARDGPDARRVAWDPYPISLRLENWCAYFFGLERERTLAAPELRDRLWASIHAQAEWLAARPEYHLRGNHLFENAAALAFVGACFDGPAAEGWRRDGIALLADEMAEQLLPDGSHFERSPLYQARIVWVLRALVWTGDAALCQLCEAPLARATAALAQLTHPDGEIALLNDAALGIANRPEELGASAAEPGPFALAPTGYYGARSAEGHYVVCDAAPVGPDYIPGHAHGDLLSFELSLGGRRVFVDAGVHDYEVGESRDYCRSTAAHNTLEIERADQCEFWGAFRVARRGRPHDVVWQPDDAGGFALEAWHDGYRRLAGAPRHRRRWRWHADGVLLVRDEVTAGRAVEGRTWLHVAPDCELERAGEREAVVRWPGGACRVVFAGDGRLSVEPSRRFPEFGVERPSQALCFTARGAQQRTGFGICSGPDPASFDLDGGVTTRGLSYGF